MNLINKKLNHSYYGPGVISKFYEKKNTFWVYYEREGHDKGPYKYPEALTYYYFTTDYSELNNLINSVK